MDSSIGSEYGGSTGSQTSEDLEEELLFMQVDEAVDQMPELLPAGYMDSNDESDSLRIPGMRWTWKGWKMEVSLGVVRG